MYLEGLVLCCCTRSHWRLSVVITVLGLEESSNHYCTLKVTEVRTGFPMQQGSTVSNQKTNIKLTVMFYGFMKYTIYMFRRARLIVQISHL